MKNWDLILAGLALLYLATIAILTVAVGYKKEREQKLKEIERTLDGVPSSGNSQQIPGAGPYGTTTLHLRNPRMVKR